MTPNNDPYLSFPTIFPRQLPGKAARVFHILQQLRNFERLPPMRQDALIAAQLRHLLQHSKARSPFWAERLSHWQPSAETCEGVLRGVPILTRKDLAAHGESLGVTFPERDAFGTVVNASSGSTGMPVRFQQAPGLFGPLYHAVTMLAAEWHGFDPAKPLGVIGSKEKDQPRAKLTIPFSWFGPAAFGFSYRSKGRDISELYDLCARGKPAYLQIGPQVLKRLAQYALASGRRDLAPERGLTFGSEVNHEIRDIVRKGLGTEIMDRYSSEETGYIALQCPKHHHYHAISPVTFVEIVDRHGQPCAIGQPGRVLLTATQSYAMPFIRYDIGDMAEWGEPCDCGITLPVIRKLWGRMSHNIVTPEGREIFVRFYGRDFADLPALLEYRFVLHRNAAVVAQLRMAPGSPRIDAEITRRVQKALGYPYPVHIRYVDAIDWGASWKQENFAVSDAPPPEDATPAAL